MLLRIWICTLIICGSTTQASFVHYRTPAVCRTDQPTAAAMLDMARHWIGQCGGHKKGWATDSDAQNNGIRAVCDATLQVFYSAQDIVGHKAIAIGHNADLGRVRDWHGSADLFAEPATAFGALPQGVVSKDDRLNGRNRHDASSGKAARPAKGALVHVRAYPSKGIRSAPRKTLWASAALRGTRDHLGFVSCICLRSV